MAATDMFMDEMTLTNSRNPYLHSAASSKIITLMPPNLQHLRAPGNHRPPPPTG